MNKLKHAKPFCYITLLLQILIHTIKLAFKSIREGVPAYVTGQKYFPQVFPV